MDHLDQQVFRLLYQCLMSIDPNDPYLRGHELSCPVCGAMELESTALWSTLIHVDPKGWIITNGVGTPFIGLWSKWSTFFEKKIFYKRSRPRSRGGWVSFPHEYYYYYLWIIHIIIIINGVCTPSSVIHGYGSTADQPWINMDQRGSSRPPSACRPPVAPVSCVRSISFIHMPRVYNEAYTHKMCKPH